MKAGRVLSAIVLLGAIALSARSCFFDTYCDFTPVILAAYWMGAGALIAGIMALTAILGGIVAMCTPKGKEPNTPFPPIAGKPGSG